MLAAGAGAAILLAASGCATPGHDRLDVPKELQARFPQTPLVSAEDALLDLHDFNHALRRTHPHLALRADLAQFDEEIAAIDEQIAGPLTRIEVWRLFSLLNPILNDGHAGVVFPDQYQWAQNYLDAGGTIFPLEVRLDELGRIFVKKESGEIASGDEIVAINGVSASRIAEQMLARAHGDTPLFRRELISRRFALMFLLLFGDTGEYEVLTVPQNGRAKSRMLAGVKELPPWLRPSRPASDHFAFKILEGGVGYLKAGSFGGEYTDDFQRFTEAAFAEFKKHGVAALIIDIRDNDGGDDPLWQEGLMQNITAEPYSHVSRYSIRITEANADPGDVVGEVQTKDYTRIFTPDPENPVRFRGRTYILIGPYTYSAAIQFAVAAQDYDIATIAGRSTGGFSCQTGRVTKIAMTRTKLNAFAPILAMTRPSGQGCDKGVEPDIPITTDPLDPDAAIAALRAIAFEEAQ